ncbi:hypothetical protein NQ176_g9765 [Zarea fungicola]|uniref:Uncharacterized protein n=1 Tax=Zarea fungicola TaxID=93591 RepID=A0ACC1MLS8_9HYPO|nr:hypothetical protein NQ176_g9765 [Lecanicillium fungicola]
MMAANRPSSSLSLPSSSSSSSAAAVGPVKSSDSMAMLYKELSTVPDRELAQPTSTDGGSSSMLSDPRIASTGNTTTNVMIVKTIRAALSELRRP